MKNYRLYLLMTTFMVCISSACSDAVTPIPTDIIDDADAGTTNTSDAGPQ